MPLLEIKNLYKSFQSGNVRTDVLKDINLSINEGEMVAIIGASGSGKSTLMNILGCLDRPSRGQYFIENQDVASLDSDAWAKLRREYFGFIFQRYQLLNDLTAEENVSIPAIYAGDSESSRKKRSAQLLNRLGLGDRITHKPSQLSGGQQQRVSIARALMNGGTVILADEPTGALDSKSGEQVLQILQELNAEGHTVIIVTHDMNIARCAKRIIEIKDGIIIGDSAPQNTPSTHIKRTQKPTDSLKSRFVLDHFARFQEAGKMAIRAILAHRMRSFLTMMGIIIGIASVVSVVALGNGSQQQILSSISGLGTNTLDIYRGKIGDRLSSRVRTLNMGDAQVIAAQHFVDGVTPSVSRTVMLQSTQNSSTGQIMGVGDQYFQVKGLEIEQGRMFDQRQVNELALVAVINQNTVNTLFKHTNPIGQTLLIDNMPVRIVGIAAEKNTSFNSGNTLTAWIPYTSAMNRLLGQTYINNLTVRLNSEIDSTAAENAIFSLLKRRHGSEDFTIINSDSIRQTIQETTGTMKLLISMIALISLIVGGIGVMNIMLVSVTERTQEIGVRMAVGARQSDIQQQFLIESVLLCLVGGIIGILLSLLFGWAFDQFNTPFTLIYSTWSIIAAFVCSSLIGIAFGFLPARRAAALDPVDALSRK